MTARDKFNGIEVDFWDCLDGEVLEHTDPISALEALVELHRERGRLTEDVMREMGPLTVSGYRKRLHSDGEISDAAERALDAVTEALDDEEHGHPDGLSPMFTVDVLARHLPVFEAAVRGLVAEGKIWNCEVAHTVELSPDEAIEILLTERPEWFGGPPAPAARDEPALDSGPIEWVNDRRPPEGSA